MNERLRELYRASKPKEALVSQDQYQSSDVLLGSEVQKFAELLILECAKICIEQNVSNLDLDVIRESGKFTVQDLATKSCGENLSKQIKQYFGVDNA